MDWLRRFRERPLRTKLLVTVIGAVVAVVGASTYLSFRYWQQEAFAAAEQQALLAARSVRTSVEAALTAGNPARARRSLIELVEHASIRRARVYGPDGTIRISSVVGEEGNRPGGVWIPSATELPAEGIARAGAEEDHVEAFVPLTAGGVALLEVSFSLEPLQAAMERGARLGLVLLIGSLAAVILIISTMIEREVVAPIERVAGMLEPEERDPAGRRDEVGRIEASVGQLIRKGREAEQQLLDQAGLAEVGEMAAEMAHEFKRPLASIRSAVGLLEQEYELEGTAERLLSSVDVQLEKLTETMRDLFSLAKPVELESDRVELPDVINSALLQLGGMPCAEGKEVVRELDPATPPVWGDAHRLEQAALNVMLNAMEAMDPGGTLTVRLAPWEDGAELSFLDTGPGIPSEDVEHVVRPFYSTKPLGTGLGLPLVARITQAHHGRLDIESQPGVGTTVRIRLRARPTGVHTEEDAWPARAS